MTAEASMAGVWRISQVRLWRLFGASVLISATLFFSSQLALAQFSQQGPKLVGTGAVGSADQGVSVALSGDGSTAIVGGIFDNREAGAAWVYTLSGGAWTQQGSKLVGADAVGPAQQGTSVALSADGNSAIVGGLTDNAETGAAWVYTRSGGVWTQQGSKLVGTGAVGSFAEQGRSVALSADGNTAIVGDGSPTTTFIGSELILLLGRRHTEAHHHVGISSLAYARDKRPLF
jgi:antibiotic biosynthesis monooxygenase (ABM) superfamily enzyme